MNSKIIEEEEKTYSSISSTTPLPKPHSLTKRHQAHSKLKTKYQQEYNLFKEETRLKTNQRLLKLNFIIRNTMDLNTILAQHSPEDD